MPEVKFQKKHAEVLEATQFKNPKEKQMRGEVLSGTDMKFMSEYISKHMDESVETFGTYAKNQSELADALGVNRKTIQRWRKDNPTTFPKPKPDGRWDIMEVVKWRDLLGIKGGDLHSKESEQIRSIMLQNEKLEIQIGIIKGEYTPNVDIDQQVSEMVQHAKRELLALPASLAPQVVGQSIAEAEKILRMAVVESLKTLHENEWQSNGQE